MAFKKYTPTEMAEYKEHKQKEVKEYAAKIENQFGIIANSETALIEFMQGFKWLHQYSVRNCLLARAQLAGATMLAPFTKWKQQGIKVKKGAKAIKIFAPITVRKWADKDGTPVAWNDDKADHVETEFTAFKLVPVFDISQTDAGEDYGKALAYKAPDFGGAELWDVLATIAGKHGYSVRLSHDIADTAAAHGLTKHGKKQITVSSHESPHARVKILAHEIGHALMHRNLLVKNDYHERRGEYECEAESFAFMLLDYLGVDCSAISVPYLEYWSGRDGKQVEKAMSRVWKHMQAVVKELEPMQVQSEVALVA